MEEVIIIGSGNAGWTAAIYTARARLNPIVLTGFELGGQLTETSLIENFPGFPNGIAGLQLMQNMQKQAERFGVNVIMDLATEIKKRDDGTFVVKTNSKEFETKSVIIATGSSARWLGIESEAKFKGQGIHTCATCDAFFYKEKVVAVVGGGDSACEAATYLTKFAKKVYMIHRRDELRASKYMQDKVLNSEVEIIWNSQIVEFKGDSRLSSIDIHNKESNETTNVEVNGVFLELGHVPNTKFIEGFIDLDDHKYINSKNDVLTNVEGIFCAGDVADTRYQQAIVAAGSGCKAALEVEHYLERFNSGN